MKRHLVSFERINETAFRFTCIETGCTGTVWVHYLRDNDGGLLIWDGAECAAVHDNVKKRRPDATLEA